MPEQQAPSETNTPAAAAAPAPEVKAELDRQMAISLNGGVPPQAAASAPAGAPGAAASIPSTPADPFGIFKEKFGYETPEAAVQDIETLRAFRAAPPTQPLKFENEVSQRIAEALQGNKLNEVYDILDQQIKIDRLTSGEMTAESASDVVKLGMQLKYKDLTPAQINFKFNKQYGLPSKPALLPAEDQDEYTERIAQWQAQVDDKKMELLIDATIARPELASSK